MNTAFTYFIVSAAVIAPWIFLIVLLFDKRRAERMQRETLVYLKSSSAYEAEDAIDRIDRRSGGVAKKMLAKNKKESENLSTGESDMATEIREEIKKHYDIGPGT